jgi:glycosyltransferase involved in cell wall biosynthesis
MLEALLAASEPFPEHLHNHIVQLYLIKHRRPPGTDAEQRRAVFEYLTRTQRDTTGTVRIHLSPALEAWLKADDEHVTGWGPVPRLAALVHQFSRDLRKRFDLVVERDYKEFACYVALSLQGALRWPEGAIADSLRVVLWEPAPGVESSSRVGVTRVLQYIRRNAAPIRHLDLSRVADLSHVLALVLSDIDQGKLPSYALSPAQYAYLSKPVPLKRATLRLSGLMHHLLVERGHVSEKDLARPEVADAVRREVGHLLVRMRLPACLREAHGVKPAEITPMASHPGAAAPAPVVTVVGPLGHGSGLGAAARACVEAFKRANLSVEALNLVADWGRNDEDRGTGLVTTVRGDINVIHFNPDVIIENLSRFGIGQFEGRYNIGFCFWETSKPCLAHRLGLQLVDELWVATEYNRRAFQAVTDKPVIVVGTPVPRIGDLAWASRAYFGLADDRFTFLYAFDGASRFTRKNPHGALRAFRMAFPDDDGVRFVIKTQNTQWLTAADERIYAEVRRMARDDRRIVVIDESFSANEVHGLISVCDCYVALHRSEGFGFGMAEAMKLRRPVIATGYSGNADFTTDETSYPVRHRLVPVPPRQFVYDEDGQEWAEPDLEHAAMRMLEVRSDPHRDVKLQRAYDLVTTRYGEEAVAATYRERIEAIRAGNPSVPGYGRERASA